MAGDGFDVKTADLRTTANQYKTESEGISTLSATTATNVGPAQVGRRFAAVAAPYQQAFTGFGANLDAFGSHTSTISQTLTSVADDYDGVEQTNKKRLAGSGGGGGGGQTSSQSRGGGTRTGGGGSESRLRRGEVEAMTAEQRTNAQTIVDAGRRMGISERGQQIALATAMQESRLRNLNYGDRDSLGLFQQRPSQGWGTAAQVTTPTYAAEQFYRTLQRVPGWENMPLTQAAQRVQRSGFPDAYAQWEPLARNYTQQPQTPTR